MSSLTHPRMYDKPECPFCWKVRLAMQLVGFSCEFIFVDTNNKPPELLALNSGGTVPVLLVDRVIAGSDEILNYLSVLTQHAVLQPSKKADAMHEYANNVLGRGTKDWIFTHRDTPPDQWQQNLLDAAQNAWLSSLDELEQHCCAGPWFLGASPSIADCALFPRFAIAMHYGIGDLSRHPHLSTWFDSIQGAEIYTATAPTNYV